MRIPLRRTAAATVLTVALAASGCSSSSGHTAPASRATSTTARTTLPPAGPSATFGGPLTGGKGIGLVAADPGPSLTAAGYTEAEYTASGVATSYRAPGGLPTNGRFRLVPAGTASYETRIVVRRPADPAKFNGTVVVEWLNVSGGADSPAEYTYIDAELVRRGYAWVGVSAQRIGVEGGAVAVPIPGLSASRAPGIKGTDPARYHALHHPGDAYSYDIFTQVARSLRRPGAVDPLHGLDVARLLAVGESQAAFTLTTYVDGVQPLTHEFDGFLLHSRARAPALLADHGSGFNVVDSITGPPTIIRTDQSVPVMLLETETDVLGVIGYYPARQPDNPHIRLWEMAGTAHADKHQVGAAESYFGCSLPINRGQQTYVLQTALHDLNAWVEGGPPPRTVPQLSVKMVDGKPSYVLDAVGNVEGGVRTPAVDAPVDVLSGLPSPHSNIVCLLSGSTQPIPASTLATLYPSRAAYLAAYTRATDAAIKAGYVLPADRAELLAEAQPSRIPR